MRGRQCISADVGDLAASKASQAVAGAGLPTPPRTSWLRRSLSRIPSMSRMAASGPLPVRNLVTLLGGIIAIVTALSAPIGYGIIGHLKEAQSLTYKSELTASRAAQYIYAPEAPWKYDTDQLAA